MSDVAARLADELLDLQCTLDPLNATMAGVPGYDHLLPDPSVDAEQNRRRTALRLAKEAELVDPSTTDADPVTAAVVAQQAGALVDRIDAAMVEHAVTDNNYVGAAAMLLTLMPIVALSDDDGGAAYLSRLRRIPSYLDAVGQRHRAGLATGRVPVRRLVVAAIAHIDRYLADPAADPLLGPEAPPGSTGFAAERNRLLATAVRPAFDKYRALLAEKLAPRARADDRPGLTWLPDGGATYEALARVHTTTDRTPEDLHQTGLELIANLRAEYAELGGRVFGTADLAEIFRRLTTDPDLRWASADDLLASARNAIDRAEAEVTAWFGSTPGQRCEVRPVPAAEAPGAPFAYYFSPSLDGTRPGVYYANTNLVEQRYRFTSEAIAFHEAVPGHHMQLTIALERTDLPLLRRVADINAFIEGWGLYSERLADEMGLYTDDLARLGMLTMDSMRAGRLVVDTGLHALGWSRHQAVEFLRQNTPMAALEIDSEVDRYIALAGQALSYMVGRLEIQRIRDDASQRLGPAFDIRAFHDLVIGGGALPLSVLDNVVSHWLGVNSKVSGALAARSGSPG